MSDQRVLPRFDAATACAGLDAHDDGVGPAGELAGELAVPAGRWAEFR
ncbi:hypothetical protein [Arthrobacter sp. UYEF36]